MKVASGYSVELEFPLFEADDELPAFCCEAWIAFQAGTFAHDVAAHSSAPVDSMQKRWSKST